MKSVFSATILLLTQLAAVTATKQLQFTTTCDTIVGEEQRLNCLVAEVREYQNLKNALTQLEHIQDEFSSAATPISPSSVFSETLGAGEPEKTVYTTPQLVWLCCQVVCFQCCTCFCFFLAIGLYSDYKKKKRYEEMMKANEDDDSKPVEDMMMEEAMAMEGEGMGEDGM